MNKARRKPNREAGLLLALLLAVTTLAVAGRASVPVARDLAADGRLAAERRLPILLVVAASDCAYCIQLEEDFLIPMLISGDYDDRVIIRKIEIDQANLLRDFDGRLVTTSELADRYRASLTPTLLFLDPQGRELVERMVGLTTPDFFGGYLDQAIDAARENLRARPSPPSAATP